MNTLTCATFVQEQNHFPEKQIGLLQPNEVPQGPWQIITSDFIFGLPKSDGFDALLVTSDHFTKQVHITACHKTATAEDAATKYIKDVFKHHGTPRQIITDRGPQFASKYLHAIYKKLGIKPTMSIAFHPQTDGQTERWNQEIKQYLRMFIDYRQTDWAKHLPIAEFALNNRAHSTTGYSPFFLLYGHHPLLHCDTNPFTTIPAADERIKELHKIQQDVEVALKSTTKKMKFFYDKHVNNIPDLQPGVKVWLEATNLNIKQPSQKLYHKQLGPFTIKQQLSKLNYKLNPPSNMKIHPVFHVNLLTPIKTSTTIKQDISTPAPIEIDGQEEYEVEKLLDSRIYRNQFQYLVQWKGDDTSHNSWEPFDNVTNSRKLIQQFHTKYKNTIALPISKLKPFHPTYNTTPYS